MDNKRILPGRRIGNQSSTGFKAGGAGNEQKPCPPPFVSPVLKQQRVSPGSCPEFFLNDWEHPVAVDQHTFSMLHTALSPIMEFCKPFLVVVIIFSFGCKKCYDCEAKDDWGVYDQETVCGKEEKEDYLDTFNDVDSRATCKPI